MSETKINASDLVNMLNTYLQKKKDDEAKAKIEAMRQDIIAFVSSDAVMTYINDNFTLDNRCAFKNSLIDALSKDNFQMWISINSTS